MLISDRLPIEIRLRDARRPGSRDVCCSPCDARSRGRVALALDRTRNRSARTANVVLLGRPGSSSPRSALLRQHRYPLARLALTPSPATEPASSASRGLTLVRGRLRRSVVVDRVHLKTDDRVERASRCLRGESRVALAPVRAHLRADRHRTRNRGRRSFRPVHVSEFRIPALVRSCLAATPTPRQATVPSRPSPS